MQNLKPVMLCATVLLAGFAIAYEEVNLNNTAAVRDGNGNLVVLGTQDGTAKERAFDGNVDTFWDPSTATANAGGGWCGLQMSAPKLLTRIRYYGRSNYAFRMRGALIQGANQADFSDAVTLHVLNPPSDWTGATWVEEYLYSVDALTRTWTYFRIYTPQPFVPGAHSTCCAGNPGEIEFYGNDVPTDGGAAPAAPSFSLPVSMNGHFAIYLAKTSDAYGYEIQRKINEEVEYSACMRVSGRVSSTLWIIGDVVPNCSNHFRIRAANLYGCSPWTEFSFPRVFALSGTIIGHANNSTYKNVFDGNPGTICDSGMASGSWAGLDLGCSRKITQVRYIRRAGQDGVDRTRGSKFQVANLPDFSDAVTIHEVTTLPTEYAVAVATLDQSAEGRYVRFLSSDGGYGNMAEVEFDTSATPTETPGSPAISRSDLTNQFAVLTWAAATDASMSTTVVWRARSAGGPWTRIGSVPAATTTFTDTQLAVGARFYYALSYERAVDGEIYAGERGDYTTYRRLTRLERDWTNLSVLKTGVSIINDYSPGSQTAGGVNKLFDNNTATFADIPKNDGAVRGDVRFGVDLGSAYSIGFIRALPRQNGDGNARAPGHIVYAANTSDWDETHPLTGEMAFASKGSVLDWGEFASADETPYRYVWLRRPDAQSFGNFAELEFYGWDGSSILEAPENLSFKVLAGSICLTWQGCPVATSYRVERAVGDSDSWNVVGTVSSETIDDTSVLRDGTSYRYRVVSVGSAGDELLSQERVVIPYVPGNGTGVTGIYTWPWHRDAYDEVQTVVTNTDDAIDFDWGEHTLVPGHADATNNVHVSWRGKLIVPRAGLYTFATEADDWLTLRIDGQFLVNAWGQGESSARVNIELTAGEHDLFVDYADGTGAAVCRLKWSGAVAEETIPSSQLIPVPHEDISSWEGSRSFCCLRQGAAIVNENTIRIGSAYGDIDRSQARYHFLWRRRTGNFDARMHVRNLGNASKILLMARASLDVNAPFIGAVVGEGTTYKYGVKKRMAYNGTLTENSPAWTSTGASQGTLRLVRMGDEFTCYWRNDGASAWTTLGTYKYEAGLMGDTLFVGPAACSTSNTSNTTPLFHEVSNFRITPILGMKIIFR